MILLIFFIFFLLYALTRKSKSVAIIMILIQIVSLCGTFFIGNDYPIDTFFKAFNLVITAIILTLLIAPWIKVTNIKNIYVTNELKLKKMTYTLLILSFIPFIVLLPSAIFVHTLVDDINTFKYSEGVSLDFYYNILPVNVRAFILATYLYYFSYFLIPLHFYYLGKKNIRLAILCFIFSLNVILYGLTFFSRWVVVIYILTYVSFFIILHNTVNQKLKKNVKVILIIVAIMSSIYFISTTSERFTDDRVYAATVPSQSKIKDPVLYSYLDYLSQWYDNSNFLLNHYEGNIFNGQISLQHVLSLLSRYNIVRYNTENFKLLRRELWPDKYWYSFNGFVAYSIYDYGYILSMILILLYYCFMKKLRPKRNQITLINLFILALLIQLPLMAIFYSNVAGLIIPLLLIIPFILYLKVTFVRYS